MENEKEYIERVEHFFEVEGINCLSPNYDDDGDTIPYFSHSNCDCCNTSLGGDRLDCGGYNPIENKIYEYSVCFDCVYYSEYGELLEH